MLLAIVLGHNQVEGLPDGFHPRPAEQPLGARAPELDCPGPVNDYEGMLMHS
jgi:hypothetical protein